MEETAVLAGWCLYMRASRDCGPIIIVHVEDSPDSYKAKKDIQSIL